MSDEIKKAARHARRAEKFPADAKCASCPESDPIVLVADSDPLTCYQCQELAAGKSGVEADHFGRRANSNHLYRLSANDHRRISEMQQDWPLDTLRNPNKSPLLKGAAVLRAWLDYLRLIIDRSVGWMPSAIEALDQCLTTNVGDRWWEKPQFLAFLECVENA